MSDPSANPGVLDLATIAWLLDLRRLSFKWLSNPSRLKLLKKIQEKPWQQPSQ